MPTGIHGQRAARFGSTVPRLRELGFRVVVGDDADPAVTDVTDVASGLRYAARLPGGYADCSFSLQVPLADAIAYLQPLTPVRVYFRGALAWEGRIEEPPRGVVGTEALPVVALGYGADLKQRKFTKLFVTSGYGRWRGCWELLQGQVPAAAVTWYSPGFAPNSNTNPGFVVGFNVGATLADTDDHAFIWIPPAGCEILRVKGSLDTIGPSTTTKSAFYADSTIKGVLSAGDETILATRTAAAGATTYDLTLAASRAYLRIDWQQDGGVAGAVDANFFHYYAMQIVGARTAEGTVYDPAQVTTYAAIRTLLNEFGGGVVQTSEEAMSITSGLPSWIPGSGLAANYAWSELVFDSPTTVEDAITQLNSVVGWEWGVFESGLFYYGPLHIITTYGRSDGTLTSGGSWPPWWIACLAQDGHKATLTQSIADVVNEVYVRYTDATGVAQSYYASDFANGLNPLNQRDGSGPRQIRTATVDLPGTSDAATAAGVASAYLVQHSRAQVKGDIVWAGLDAPKVEVGGDSLIGGVNVGSGVLSTNTLDGGARSTETVATPLIRPGWWIDVEDSIGLRDESGATTNLIDPDSGQFQVNPAPPGLLPIRSVEVDADQGIVTCSVDTSRDVFGPQLARLTRAAA